MKNLIIILFLFITSSLNAQWEIFGISYYSSYERRASDVSMINADNGYVLVYNLTSGIYQNIKIYKTNDKGQNWYLFYSFNSSLSSIKSIRYSILLIRSSISLHST